MLEDEQCQMERTDTNIDMNARLMAICQDNLSKPVPECLHPGFYWS